MSGLAHSEAGSYFAGQVAGSLKAPLAGSITFHLFLFGALFLSSVRSHRGELWGGPGGGSITVGLVAEVPGIPLPRPEVTTASRVVDVTKGLYKAEAEPKPKEPATPTTPIPKFERYKQPRYVTRPSRVLENPETPPPNAIPYGQGGTPTLPFTSFAVGSAEGGLAFSGPGGAFGARFPWYVEAVRRRISSNWLQSTVDPTIRWAPRVVIDFEILRDGSITNIQLMRTSGNSSVDSSAIRAIQLSNPLDRLPGEYGGSVVNVEFYFDFHR